MQFLLHCIVKLDMQAVSFNVHGTIVVNIRQTKIKIQNWAIIRILCNPNTDSSSLTRPHYYPKPTPNPNPTPERVVFIYTSMAVNSL